ncbi:hypothetical protein JTB14_014914 [Gonioctena quinquepunctata]|nr:hypothetical protein JTB14_014914 [Gonioctena quinquepunctata]
MELRLWSDCCGGQNRSIKLILQLIHALQNHPTIDKITIRFLLPAHSFLPNDFEFDDVESTLKEQERLYTDSDYMDRKLTEWVPHLHQQEYHNRLTALILATLKERRHLGDLIQCYRILSNTLSVDLGHILPLNVDERLRGHSLKLLKEEFRTSIGQHLSTNRVFHEWNSLTDNIVLAPSINAFKNRLDKYYNSS